MIMSDVFRYDLDLRVLILTNQMTHYMFSIVNDVRINIPPQTPLLYSENGVYRGKHIFFIFATKHRLWVLTCTLNLCFEQK